MNELTKENWDKLNALYEQELAWFNALSDNHQADMTIYSHRYIEIELFMTANRNVPANWCLLRGFTKACAEYRKNILRA